MSYEFGRQPCRRKYRNRPVGKYDSKKEANRAAELRAMQRTGLIYGLREQVKFVLIPAQYLVVNGKRTCVERAVTYTADFVYYTGDLRSGKVTTIVEDTKSPVSRTQQYVIRRKLMLHVHGVQVREL